MKYNKILLAALTLTSILAISCGDDSSGKNTDGVSNGKEAGSTHGAGKDTTTTPSGNNNSTTTPTNGGSTTTPANGGSTTTPPTNGAGAKPNNGGGTTTSKIKVGDSCDSEQQYPMFCPKVGGKEILVCENGKYVETVCNGGKSCYNINVEKVSTGYCIEARPAVKCTNEGFMCDDQGNVVKCIAKDDKSGYIAALSGKSVCLDDNNTITCEAGKTKTTPCAANSVCSSKVGKCGETCNPSEDKLRCKSQSIEMCVGKTEKVGAWTSAEIGTSLCSDIHNYLTCLGIDDGAAPKKGACPEHSKCLNDENAKKEAEICVASEKCSNSNLTCDKEGFVNVCKDGYIQKYLVSYCDDKGRHVCSQKDGKYELQKAEPCESSGDADVQISCQNLVIGRDLYLGACTFASDNCKSTKLKKPLEGPHCVKTENKKQVALNCFRSETEESSANPTLYQISKFCEDTKTCDVEGGFAFCKQ